MKVLKFLHKIESKERTDLKIKKMMYIKESQRRSNIRTASSNA